MKKTASLTLAVLLLSAVAAFAGSREDLARQMLRLTDMQKLMDQVVDQVQQIQLAQLESLDIPADKREQTTAFQNRLMKKVFDAMSWQVMEPEYVKLFADVYSEEELKAIVAFFKSPAGQSMLNKQPELLQKSMSLSQQRMQAVMPELQRMIRDFSQEMKTAPSPL
jgi:hypothetical protein